VLLTPHAVWVATAKLFTSGGAVTRLVKP
jgi:hypothetical protein